MSMHRSWSIAIALSLFACSSETQIPRELPPAESRAEVTEPPAAETTPPPAVDDPPPEEVPARLPRDPSRADLEAACFEGSQEACDQLGH